MSRHAAMPSSVSPEVGAFDRFAGWASAMASRAWFFAGCVALIVVWVPTLFLLDLNTAQLLINTATTIITFLLVALIQNSQERANKALQHKLNAIAAGLNAALRAARAEASDADDIPSALRLAAAMEELHAAVGLEERESS